MEVEVEPTMGLGLRVWWALTWRATLMAMGAGLVIGFAVGFLGSVTGVDKAMTSGLSALVNLPISVYLVARVAHSLMTKGFGPYRLAVVKEQAGNASG